MADDKLDFLEDEPKAEAEPTPEPQEEVKAEAEPVPEETGEKEPEVPPTPEEPQEAKHAPITALLDEREKRQKYEAEARRLQQQLEQLSQKQEPAPDFFDNPDQAVQHHLAQMQADQWNRTLNASKYRVARSVGDADLVDQAEQAFSQAVQANPSLYVEFQNHPEPYDYVVEWHKKQQFMAEVKDPDQWKEAQMQVLREQIKAELLAETPQSAPPKAPPPSMSSAGAVGNEPKPPASGFDAIFDG